VCRACAAKKSLSLPASASTTTSAWSDAASEEVLDAVANALQLDEAERSHLDCDAFLDEQLGKHRLSATELKAWRPVKRARGRKAAA
jgi:hypothetical protein